MALDGSRSAAMVAGHAARGGIAPLFRRVARAQAPSPRPGGASRHRSTGCRGARYLGIVLHQGMRIAACLLVIFGVLGCGDDDGPRSDTDGGTGGPDGS